MNPSTHFLSCDWGTTSFRLRLVDAIKKEVVGSFQSGQGVAATYEAWSKNGSDREERIVFYKSVITEHFDLLKKKLNTDLPDSLTILLSGMASSSIGMKELSYKGVPFAIDGSDLFIDNIKNDNGFPYDLYLCSGVRTDRDVMRGEEVQIIGAVDDNGDASQTLILPGTHSKHASIKDGKLVSFRTFMTGDFFQLLSQKSLLAQSVEASTDWSGEHQQAFEKGVKDSIDKSILQSAFQVRTNQLFHYYDKQSNYFYLSGLLIGNELQYIDKSENLMLVSEPALARYYETAMQTLGLTWKFIDVEQSVVKGHCKVLQGMNLRQ